MHLDFCRRSDKILKSTMQLKLVFIISLLWFISSTSLARLHPKHKTTSNHLNLFKRSANSLEEIAKNSSSSTTSFSKNNFINLILKDHKKLTINLLSPKNLLKYSIFYSDNKIFKIPSECFAETMDLFKIGVLSENSEYLTNGASVKSNFVSLPLSFPTNPSKNKYMEKCPVVQLDKGLVSSKLGQHKDNYRTSDNGLCCKARMANIWLELTGKYKKMSPAEQKYKLATWLPRLIPNPKHEVNQLNNTANVTLEKKVDPINILETNKRRRSINVLGD